MKLFGTLIHLVVQLAVEALVLLVLVHGALLVPPVKHADEEGADCDGDDAVEYAEDPKEIAHSVIAARPDASFRPSIDLCVRLVKIFAHICVQIRELLVAD